MLGFLRESGKLSERKSRLFVVACCRLMDRWGNTSGLAVVELAERVADGLLPLREALPQEASVQRLYSDSWGLSSFLNLAARQLIAHARPQGPFGWADLLRCTFGNPFRAPPRIDPGWLTWQSGTVLKLAHAAYEERQLPGGHLEPVRLAILADALEEAGCSDQAVLAHLRDPGPHLRGCFAVDAVLGKE